MLKEKWAERQKKEEKWRHRSHQRMQHATHEAGMKAVQGQLETRQRLHMEKLHYGEVKEVKDHGLARTKSAVMRKSRLENDTTDLFYASACIY